MLPRRLAYLLAFLLLLAGAARIGWMIGHQPLLGYANQFDMGRTSACFGMWPDLPEPARYEPHRAAPIARYVDGEHRPDECYLSSELLFSGTAIATWKLAADAGLASPNGMDLRYVGGFKAIMLLLLALAFTLRLGDRPAWMLAHAAVFALVLADPVVTLWLNTLYTEFAAVFFAYAAIMCLVMIAGTGPERSGWYVAFGCALLGLGLSRQQHALLPACLLLLAWPAIRQYHRRLAWPLALAALAVAVLQAVVIVRPPSISAANNTNVALGALLPAAADQRRALAHLGLPPGCEAVIGATWYVTMGEDLGARCPEAMSVSRLRVAQLVLMEPLIGVRALLKAAPMLQPALLRYVGIDESREFGTLRDQNPVLGFSIATAIERLPVAVFLGALFVFLSAFAVSLAGWLTSSLRYGSPSMDPLLGSALGGIFAYAVLTSVFGDGLVEIPRHAHLGLVAMLVLLVLGVALVTSRLFALFGRRARMTLPADQVPAARWFPWALLAVLIAVPASGPLWLPAWKQQPLAIGVVDEPQSNIQTRSTITLRGWTMDPFGPARAVTLINGSVRVDAHAWRHPTDPEGVALGRTFPTYREPAGARFETVIDAAAFGGRPISVRTYAQNPDGIVTEIDRRVIRWLPR